jgi:hypothetical protein
MHEGIGLAVQLERGLHDVAIEQHRVAIERRPPQLSQLASLKAE